MNKVERHEPFDEDRSRFSLSVDSPIVDEFTGSMWCLKFTGWYSYVVLPQPKKFDDITRPSGP